MTLFLIWLGMAVLTAIAANAKNRSAFLGFLAGFFFSVFALIGYLVVKPASTKAVPIREGLLANSLGERQCPHCAELIKIQASKCKFCGSEVTPISEAEAKAAHEAVYMPIRQDRTLTVIGLIAALIIVWYFFRK